MKASTISPLRAERERRGWSRSYVEIVTEMRISAVSLERWEEGKAFPRSDNIDELCKLYGKSPEELRLVKSHDIMGTDNNAPMSNAPTSQEEYPIMSDLIRRSLFSNLGSKLFSLIDRWPRRNYHYEELQAEINKAVVDYNVIVTHDSTYELTRRQALKDMALVPVQLVGGIAIIEAGEGQKTDTDILLKHCAAGITACWYLRRGSDLAFVSDLTSSYISILQPLIYSHSESYRKASATLLAQSFMLKSHLGSEDELACAERAIYYGDLSKDPITQALAYRRRAYEYWHIKNYKDALPDAEKGYGLARSNKAIPKIIHSITAATLSLCQASNGHMEDAKLSLTEARTRFDPIMPVPSMSYSESILTAIAGGVHRQIGRWGEAATLYEKSLTIPDISALGAIEQRINYAKNEINRDDRPRDMGLCIKLLTESITRAEELNSQRFIREAGEVYDLFKIAWPREGAIKTLGRDHFGGK
jgi:transcriptional regulator with XRE-family HTH domain/tetratricopeptide (TPR) repeat protein